MDGFADGMIARGPTLAPDRQTWTGSVHIVEVPSADAAREFVERDPYHRAGLFDQHLIRGFTNLLGRTMWEFHAASDEPRFLVIAQDAGPRPDLGALPLRRLIVWGELLTLEDARPAGVVLALQAPTREALATVLDGEILDWEFGGRR